MGVQRIGVARQALVHAPDVLEHGALGGRVAERPRERHDLLVGVERAHTGSGPRRPVRARPGRRPRQSRCRPPARAAAPRPAHARRPRSRPGESGSRPRRAGRRPTGQALAPRWASASARRAHRGQGWRARSEDQCSQQRGQEQQAAGHGAYFFCRMFCSSARTLSTALASSRCTNCTLFSVNLTPAAWSFSTSGAVFEPGTRWWSR